MIIYYVNIITTRYRRGFAVQRHRECVLIDGECVCLIQHPIISKLPPVILLLLPTFATKDYIV